MVANSKFEIQKSENAHGEKPARHSHHCATAKSIIHQGLGPTDRFTVVVRVTLTLLPSVPMSVSLKTPEGVPTGAGLMLFR
jgi:hypothetical protein